MGQADVLHDLGAHRGAEEQVDHAGHHRGRQPTGVRRGFGERRSCDEQYAGDAELHEGDGNRVEPFGIDAQESQVEREDDRGGDGQPVAGAQRQRTARLQRDEADAGQTDHAGDQVDGLRPNLRDDPCGERGEDAIGRRQKRAAPGFDGPQPDGLGDHRTPIGQARHQCRHDDLRRQIRHDMPMEQRQHAQAGTGHAQPHQPLGRNRLHGDFGEQIAASPQRGAAQQHESGEIRGKAA